METSHRNRDLVKIERWKVKQEIYWQKFEDLINKIDIQGLKSLDTQNLQLLAQLYRSTASDLSRARALQAPEEIISYLNNLVLRGHNFIYQSESNSLKDLCHFLWIKFPNTIRANALYIAIAFLLFIIPSIATWQLVKRDINVSHMEILAGQSLVSDELWSIIEQGKMWTDSAQSESPVIASSIASNNIRVAILAFIFGITFGIGTIYILVTNGMLIGATFATCDYYNMSNKLLTFIAPHGIFELSAIFISGGAGLMIAKALLFPGQYKRLTILKLKSKQALLLFLGNIPILLIAGCIEGFISPRTDLSIETKFTISVCTFLLLFYYIFGPKEN